MGLLVETAPLVVAEEAPPAGVTEALPVVVESEAPVVVETAALPLVAEVSPVAEEDAVLQTTAVGTMTPWA